MRWPAAAAARGEHRVSGRGGCALPLASLPLNVFQRCAARRRLHVCAVHFHYRDLTRKWGGGVTYCQILRSEAAQARQVPPAGGAVELLHLLGQLLLQPPLLFVLLCVSELDHDGGGAALWGGQGRKRGQTDTSQLICGSEQSKTSLSRRVRHHCPSHTH